MIIAITGGNGFIGKMLVDRHLEMGDQVRLLARTPSSERKNVKYFLGDLSIQNYNLAGFLENVDILYHCAGEINNESLMHELHIQGTQRLADAAKGRISRWVQLSSVGVYGLCRSGIVNENSKEQPFGVYESTKNQSDNIVKKSGIPYVILQPSNVFGDEMPNQSLRALLDALRRGIFVFVGKEDEALVNYVHVTDVVDALILCGFSEKALGEVFIVSQSSTVSNMILSLASGIQSEKKILRFPEPFIRFIAAIFGWIPAFPLTSRRVNALTGKCVYNSNKIEKILDFRYSMTLEEGLKLFARKK